jgi:hypothetical protein
MKSLKIFNVALGLISCTDWKCDNPAILAKCLWRVLRAALTMGRCTAGKMQRILAGGVFSQHAKILDSTKCRLLEFRKACNAELFPSMATDAYFLSV